jgi:tetratricopeptide (TPR) repeat protein
MTREAFLGQFAFGTRYALDGEIVGSARSVRIEARLVSAKGMVRGPWRVAGAADSLADVADRLVTCVVASLAAAHGEDSLALAATSLSALEAYLAGRSDFRHQHLAEARGHFERAIALDSTFAPASLWLAASLGLEQSTGTPDERWIFDDAWSRRDRLSAPERALLVAILGPRYPRASPLAEVIAASEAATRAAPNSAEAWSLLATNLERFGSLVGYPDSDRGRLAALRTAASLDTENVQLLDALIEWFGRGGDTAAVRHYSNLLFARTRTTDSLGFDRWCSALVLGDSVGIALVRSRFAGLTATELVRIAIWSEWTGIGLADGARAAEVLRERRVLAQRTVALLLNRGRATEANQMLERVDRGVGRNQNVGGIREFQIYAALYWDGDSSVAALAANRLESFLRGSAMRPGEVGDQQTASCALAHWRLGRGDANGARRAVSAFGSLPSRTDALGPMVSPVCTAVVSAQLESHQAAGARKARALARLDSLLDATTSARDQLVTVGTLVSARLHDARGETTRALERIRRRAGWNFYFSTQLREEGRLAAVAGDTAEAINAYRAYLALRADPDLNLRDDAGRIRRQLRTLEQAVVRRSNRAQSRP